MNKHLNFVVIGAMLALVALTAVGCNAHKDPTNTAAYIPSHEDQVAFRERLDTWNKLPVALTGGSTEQAIKAGLAKQLWPTLSVERWSRTPSMSL